MPQEKCAVVMATQSLSQTANSPHCDVILESCPTKLYLPNPEASNPLIRDLYRKFGLSDRKIDIIANGVCKRDYYYDSPLGHRQVRYFHLAAARAAARNSCTFPASRAPRPRRKRSI